MNSVLLDVAPDVLPFVITVIVGVVGWGARELVGVTLSAERSAMLHAALRRAAIYAIDRYTDLDAEAFAAKRGERMEHAVGYMRATMPQTVKKLGLDDPEMLKAVITPHLREAESGVALPVALAR